MLLAALLCALAEPAGTGDGLAARLVLSLEYSLEERWSHAHPEADLQVSAVASVVRKQPFTGFVLVTGFALDEAGEARVEGDIRVTKPDGSTWFERKKLEILKGPVVALDRGVVSHSNLRTSFEGGDPFGSYAFTVTLRDLVANTSATATAAIRLVSFPTDVHFAAKEDALDWLHTYCRAPSPNEAVDALLTLARAGVLAAGATATRASAFFAEVFEHNPHLYPPLLARHAKEEKSGKEAILRLLARTRREASAFVAGLEPSERDAFTRMLAEPRRDPFAAPASDAMQIETLWGIFLASGSYAPLLAMCRAMGDPEEETKTGPSAGEREAIRRTARWLLGADVPAQPIVRAYLRWIRENEDLAEPAPGEIDSVLEAK